MPRKSFLNHKRNQRTEQISPLMKRETDLFLTNPTPRGTELPLSAITFNESMNPLPNTQSISPASISPARSTIGGMTPPTRRHTSNACSSISKVETMTPRQMMKKKSFALDKIIQEASRPESEITNPAEAKSLHRSEFDPKECIVQSGRRRKNLKKLLLNNANQFLFASPTKKSSFNSDQQLVSARLHSQRPMTGRA